MHKQYKVKWRNVNYVIEYNDIFYIEAYNRRLYIHEENQGHECVGKLHDEYERLKSYGFSRCHQGYLINLSKVRKIDNKSVLHYQTLFFTQRQSNKLLKLHER